MAKTDMNGLLKKRMTATQQASGLQTSDEVYRKIFREIPPSAPASIRDLPLDKLVPFFTTDIGFKPYPPSKLKAYAEQLNEEGLMVRIIVRPTGNGSFEILAGHNRANAAKLVGWVEIPAEVVEADDARAIVIATSTNLIKPCWTPEICKDTVPTWQIELLARIARSPAMIHSAKLLAKVARSIRHGRW